MSSGLFYRHGISRYKKLLLLEYHMSSLVQVLSKACHVKSNHEPSGADGETVDTQRQVEKFAYGVDNMAKRDRSSPGLFHLKTIQLPEQLDWNLKEFLKRYPQKLLENDGRQLSKHLLNRGRPTEVTWKRYKETKTAMKAKGLQVHYEDVIKLKEDQENQENTIEDEIDFNLDEDDMSKVDSSDEDATQSTEAEKDSAATILKTKRPKKEEYKVIRYNKRESAAFAASRIHASYGATLRVLHEISRREPDYKPETLMDFGSGTGMTLWAANEKWSDSIKEYQCIDVSESMNTVSEFLLRGGESYKKPLYIPHVYYKRFLPISNVVTYDTVVASYTLSELPHVVMRQEALRSLWAKTNDFLVLIEYGNNEGFEILLEARKMVEKNCGDPDAKGQTSNTERTSESVELPCNELPVDDGYVFAPCPHELNCPRSDVETRDHPCNFQQQVQLSFAERRTGLKKWGFSTERFSYLVLRKGNRENQDKPWPRILEPIKLRGRHIICKLCSSNGELEQKVLTKKKDSDIYKCVRHLSKWGDLMPLPADRTRPLKNPHISMTRKGKPRM